MTDELISSTVEKVQEAVKRNLALREAPQAPQALPAA